MKKFLALLLSVAMVFALVAVPAAAEGEVTITASTVTDVTPGDTVEITVDIGGGDYEAHVLMMNLVYDENNLTVMNIVPGAVWNAIPMDASKACDYTTNPGHIALGYMCPTNPVSAHGTFVTITFKVDENCTQDQALEVAVSEMWYNPLDGETTAVPYVAQNGAIQLVEVTPDPDAITEIEIEGFTAPAWGEHPDYTVNAPAGAHYTVDYVDWNWYDYAAEDGDILGVSETFNREDYVYYMYFEILPEEGYVIADNAAVTVNGDANVIEGSGWSDTMGYFYAYTIDYTVTEPGTPTDAPTPVDPLNVGFYFEYSAESEFDWTNVDADGDGYDWDWVGYGINQTQYANSAYEGIGYIESASYADNTALFPDNWVISPAVTLGTEAAAVSFYVKAQDPSYAQEHYRVYVGTSPEINAMQPLTEESVTPAEWTQINLDLSAYLGQTVYVAFRHFNTTDMFRMDIDQVEFWNTDGPEVPGPTNPPVVDPDADIDPALNVEGGTLHFENDPTYPWVVINTRGRLYAQSGNAGVGSSSSTITLTAEVGSNQEISFDFKAWGEGSGTPWDKCIFAIDGNAQFTYGAMQNDWTTFTCNVPAGTHTFTWTYSKDSSVDPNGDYFAVDNVEFKEREEQPVNEDLDAALNVEGGEIHFFSTGTYPWITVEEGSRFYAMSGNQGVNSSESVLTATVVAEEGDIVQFEFMAWGEGSSTFWDHCDFYVDGTRVLYYGAYDNQWETFNYVLTAGEHELKWSFTKDSSLNGDGDFFKVDNVYVGEPVHVESIVAEPVMVPVNRTALINYVVLPDAAANKAVTFECADTTIATVNANGLVTGVAEGNTTITITSVDMPDISVTIEVEVIDTGITAAYFYGICSYDMDETLTGNWVTFADFDPSAVTGIAAAPDSYAAAYAYGNVYGFTTGGDFYMAPFGNLGGYSIVASKAYTEGTIVSMAMNYANGIMYGLDSSNNVLVAIDIDSGYAEVVAAFTAEDLIAIAIDYEGNGYAVAFDGNLYSFDPETAQCTVIGNTGCSVNYVQDLCYDYNNGDLYWAQIYSQTNNGLYRLDKNTGYAESLGYIGPAGMEICGMFVVPEDEPERPTDIAVTGIELIPEEMEIRVGETGTFTAVVKPINASNKDVEWDVDDPSVIAVDANGTVIGLAVGTATVYATTIDGSLTAYGIVNVIPPLGSHVAGYFFENDPESEGWIFVDHDGDGYNWEWEDGSVGLTAYEGQGIIYSASYDNPTYSPLNPDNWAISPAIILPGDSADVTLYAKGQDPEYAAEVFAVYVGTSTDVNSMTKVAGDFTATGEYIQYSANLGDYCGQTVYVAIRHYNVTDQYLLNVDQVEFWGDGEVEGAHTLTIDYVYEDGTQAAPSYSGMFTEGFNYSITSPTISGYIANPAVVTGTMGTEDINVEVVYTEDPNACIVGWYFEESPYDEGWQFIDDDGDGYNWIWQQDYSNPPYCTAYEGEGLIYSQSYENDNKGTRGVLYPDNWAVTPAVTLPTGSAYVTLYACGQDANYAAEHFQIYAGTSDDIYDMQPISAEFIGTGTYTQYRADLTAYLGQTVYIAIRHFNIADMFYLNVDQVEVFGSDGEPVGPTQPPVEPTQPPVEPTQPPVEPTQPPVEPTQPPVEPTQPPVEPTQPPVEPTQPPVEPTDVPVEPTDVPVEPTDVPVEPTDVPVEPTPTPTPAPQTGAVSLVGLGILAMASAAGIVLFRKKED